MVDDRTGPGQVGEDTTMTTWLLAPLAVLGGLLSLYFTAVTYGWMAPDARLVPPFCRMETDTCERIVHTPEARLFGPPNALLGLAYHGLVLSWLVSRPWPPIWASALAAAALFTVAAGAWLARALLVRLRTPCPLCFAAHAINLAVAVGILATILARVS